MATCIHTAHIDRRNLTFFFQTCLHVTSLKNCFRYVHITPKSENGEALWNNDVYFLLTQFYFQFLSEVFLPYKYRFSKKQKAAKHVFNPTCAPMQSECPAPSALPRSLAKILAFGWWSIFFPDEQRKNDHTDFADLGTNWFTLRLGPFSRAAVDIWGDGYTFEALPRVLGNRGIRSFISGEQGNKSLKLKRTREHR